MRAYRIVGSGCNVCTKDPENFDEEVKSLVTACCSVDWKYSYEVTDRYLGLRIQACKNMLSVIYNSLLIGNIFGILKP